MAYNNNEYNIIDISKSQARPKKYSCNYCRRHLYLRDKETQEYICTFCNIIYYPNNDLVNKPNKFDLPGPDTDSQGIVIRNNTIPIAIVDDPNKELSSTSYKQQKLPAAYEALKKSGFTFTSYEER